MNSVIARQLLRLAGRGTDVLQPVPCRNALSPRLQDDAFSQNDEQAVADTRWHLDRLALRPGWYMLEIEHSVASIGCCLTLECEDGHQEHLLLTSKTVCKRIVHFHSALMRCCVIIDQPGCSLERLSLVALSRRFAMSRMRRRLANHGHEDCTADGGPEVLYEVYRASLHDMIIPKPYLGNSSEQTLDVRDELRCSESAGEHSLILIKTESAPGAELDSSLEQALEYARGQGWSVSWQSDPTSAGHGMPGGSTGKAYLMPVQPGVVYRQDVFHQLLCAVEQDSILVYADHDHVNATGVRFQPVLKPEWNPELLLNHNYIQTPWMIAESWVRALPRQDHAWSYPAALLLAASLGIADPAAEIPDEGSAKARSRPTKLAVPPLRVRPLADFQVKRIPLVLASRVSTDASGSTVSQPSGERLDPWCWQVRNALRNAGSEADVVMSRVSPRMRILWPLPVPAPLVSIIVPTRDQRDILRTCVDSVLRKTAYHNFRLYIVDNDSCEPETERYFQSLADDPRIELLRYPGEFNYSAINNHAVSHSESEIVVLLNNDTEVISPHWLDELVRQAMRPEIGCVGAKLYYSNGRIQHGGVIVGISGVAGHAHRYSPGAASGYCGRLLASQNLTAVTAACLALRRSIWLEAGGLDQEQLGVAWNDVDLCLRVRRLGYRNLWTPHAELFHHEGMSRGADDTRSKVRRVDAERHVMMQRWELDRFLDPAYHPLLSRDNENFALGDTVSKPAGLGLPVVSS